MARQCMDTHTHSMHAVAKTLTEEGVVVGITTNWARISPNEACNRRLQLRRRCLPFTGTTRWVERPICYASKTFTKEQRNWSASERELWTLMYFATDHFKHYLQGEFVLFTDHKPLTHLFKERGTINPKLARWAARLSRIRAKVEYRCGTVMGPADLFSRLLKDRPTKEEMHQWLLENAAHRADHRLTDRARPLKTR